MAQTILSRRTSNQPNSREHRRPEILGDPKHSLTDAYEGFCYLLSHSSRQTAITNPDATRRHIVEQVLSRTNSPESEQSTQDLPVSVTTSQLIPAFQPSIFAKQSTSSPTGVFLKLNLEGQVAGRR